jgi:hypothetical protein
MVGISPKDIAKVFFTKVNGEDSKFKCFCESILSSSKGYSNLASHMKTHVGWEEVYSSLAKEAIGGRIKQATMDMFTDRRSLSTRNWIDHIVTFNLPLTICDNKEYYRSLNPLNFDPICFTTLKNRMDLVTREIEKEISKKLQNKKLGLVFDGWSEDAIHFVGLFAVTKEDGFVLLAFSQFELPEDIEKDAHIGADAHIKMFDDNLARYGILVRNVLFFLSDNTNCNKAVAKKVGIPFIGCAAHRLALAIKDLYLNNAVFKNLLMKVNGLMKKLKTIKRSGTSFGFILFKNINLL